MAQIEAQFGAALQSLPPPPSQQAAQEAAANGEGGNGNGGNGEGGNGETQAADGNGQPAEGEGQPAEGEGAPADGEGAPAEGDGQLADGAAGPDGEPGPAPDGEAATGPNGEPAPGTNGETAPGPGEGGEQFAAANDGAGTDAGAPIGGEGANGPDAGAPLGGDTGAGAAGAFGTGGTPFGGGGGLFGDTGGGLLGGDTGGGLLGGDTGVPGVLGGDTNLLDGGTNLLDAGTNLLGGADDTGFTDTTGLDPIFVDAPPPPVVEASISATDEYFYGASGTDLFYGTALNSHYVFDQLAGFGGYDVVTDAGGTDILSFQNLDGVGIKISYASNVYTADIYDTSTLTTVTAGGTGDFTSSGATLASSLSVDDVIETFAVDDGTNFYESEGASTPLAGEIGYLVAGTAGNEVFDMSSTSGTINALVFGKGGTDELTFASHSTGVDFKVDGWASTYTSGSTLDGSFEGIEIITGSNTAADTFTMTGDLDSAGYATLAGGGGNDNFYLQSGATFSGALDGGTGTDTFYYDPNSTFNGSLTAFEYAGLLGTSGDDTFDLTQIGASIAGIAFNTVVGGGGTDSLTLDTAATSMNVTSIETITGTVNNDYIYYDSAIVAGSVDLGSGADQVHLANAVNMLSISNTELIYGGTSSDTITLPVFGTTTVDGGTGTDKVIIGSSVASSLHLYGVELVEGSADGDNIIIDDATNTAIDGGTGSATVTLSVANSISITNVSSVSGSTGTDTVTMNAAGTVNVTAMETVVGSSGADVVTNSDTTSTTFIGGAGDDTFSGYGSADTASYSGNLADFTFGTAAYGKSLKVTDTNSGDGLDEGADTVSNVETLAFTDATISVTSGGGEQLVNITTTNSQDQARIVGLANGGYAVYWHSTQTDSGDIYTRVYNALGQPVTGEIQVNQSTGNQYVDNFSEVQPLNNGGFVVMWNDTGIEGTATNGTVARIFDSTGTAVTNEFLVNTTTANDQLHLSVAQLAGGDLIFTWQSKFQDDASKYGIYGRRYSADGTPQSSEFHINTTAAGDQNAPVIVDQNNGGFAVFWEDDNNLDGTYEVYGQFYDANATQSGSEFVVANSSGTGLRYNDVIELNNANHDIVIAWYDPNRDGASNGGPLASIISSSGTLVTGPFSLHTTTTGEQGAPALTALTGGGFVATWHSNASGDYDIIAQLFNDSGTKVGGEFTVNTTTTDWQTWPAITALADGGFTISWQSNLQDGSSYGIYSQRFDASGNAVSLQTLTGGAGNDTINLASGSEVYIEGNTGTDTVTLAGGTNTIAVSNVEAVTGGAGADHISVVSLAAATSIDGGAGTDVADIQGAGFTVTLSNVESVWGSASADTIVMNGTTGAKIYGGAGNDDITGSGGADVIYGGAGDDIFRLDEGSAANDTVYGGLTNADGATATGDAVYYQNTTDNLTITLGNESGSVAGTATGTSIGTDTLYGIDKIFAGSGNDVIYGNAGTNQIDGGQGIDTIYGGMGIGDWLEGVANGDTVAYDHTTATQVGQEGVDVSLTFTQTSNIQGTVAGTGISATLNQFANVIGSQQNDTFILNAASSVSFDGSGGTDTLDMSAQTGVVAIDLSGGTVSVDAVSFGTVSSIENAVGGSGNDTITGDANANVITGSGGADNLTGGGGADVFRYIASTDSTVGTGDTILDFDAGTNATSVDSILFDLSSGFTFSFLGAETTAFTSTANLVEARFNDTTKLLEVDTNADGAADMNITLTGVSIANLDNADFSVT